MRTISDVNWSGVNFQSPCTAMRTFPPAASVSIIFMSLPPTSTLSNRSPLSRALPAWSRSDPTVQPAGVGPQRNSARRPTGPDTSANRAQPNTVKRSGRTTARNGGPSPAVRSPLKSC